MRRASWRVHTQRYMPGPKCLFKSSAQIQKSGVEQLCTSAVQHPEHRRPAMVDIIAYTIQHGFEGKLKYACGKKPPPAGHWREQVIG